MISGSVLAHNLIQLPAGVQGAVVQVGVMGYSNVTGTALLDSQGRVWVCGYNSSYYMLGLGDGGGVFTVPARVNL